MNREATVNLKRKERLCAAFQRRHEAINFKLQILKLRGISLMRGVKIGLIATMPKSGTWYNRYFLHFYSQLLAGKLRTEEIAKEKPSLLWLF